MRGQVPLGGLEVVRLDVGGTVGVVAEGLEQDVLVRVLEAAGPVVSWIDLPVTGDDGWPLETRGVVASAPGLYFVGQAFQYAFASMLVGGPAGDAEYVLKHLSYRGRTPRSSRRPDPGRRAASTAASRP